VLNTYFFAAFTNGVSPSRAAYPVRQSRTVQVHALPLVDLRLPMQRQMIGTIYSFDRWTDAPEVFACLLAHAYAVAHTLLDPRARAIE
jgi:hypothetical protein